MSQTLLQKLDEALLEALRSITPESVEFDTLPLDRCGFGPAKSAELGDYASSAAMVVAKKFGSAPLPVAKSLAEKLSGHPLLASAEAAAPGFLNVRLSAVALGQLLDLIRSNGEHFGHSNYGGDKTVLLEYVSANPTGPMHLGHCRHAATGDALARILSASGYKVSREFYINDAGVQIAALGKSFRIRVLQALGDKIDDSEIQYPGEYLEEFARDLITQKSADEIRAMSEAELAWEARNRNLEQIKQDLAALGVFFDNYVSEKAIHDSGAVEKVLELLRKSGRVYEKDGATWLQTQDFGDNEDRVIIKGDGSYTYLLPDLAYHADKYARSFDRYINVFGADHGGYPPRLRAGIDAIGYDEKKLAVIFLRLVFLTKNGQRVKFSKRAGNFVALSDVVEAAGPDATRWFMLCRSLDSEFEFDLDLAQQQSNANPVYKVQYAHARICSALRKGAEGGFTPATHGTKAMEELVAPIEREMILAISAFTGIVQRSVEELAIHHLPNYLLSVADLWNRYWSMVKTDASFRIIQEDKPALSAARLLLANSLRQVLANGLGLMGINAPERMIREEEE